MSKGGYSRSTFLLVHTVLSVHTYNTLSSVFLPRFSDSVYDRKYMISDLVSLLLSLNDSLQFHPFSCKWQGLILLYGRIIFHRVYIHSLSSGPLGCFHSLVTVNYATLNGYTGISIYFVLLMIVILILMRLKLTAVLICISRMAKDAEHFFIYSLAFCTSFEKYLLNSCSDVCLYARLHMCVRVYVCFEFFIHSK